MMQWKKKKTLEKTNSLHRQRQKKLFVSEKGFIPPPPPKKNNGPDPLSSDN